MSEVDAMSEVGSEDVSEGVGSLHVGEPAEPEIDWTIEETDLNARKKFWVWTLHNNYPGFADDLQRLLSHNNHPERVAGWVWQMERAPTTGSLHAQGFIAYNSSVQFRTIKNLVRTIWCAEARGSKKQCVDYCTKLESRVDGPFFSSLDFVRSPGQVRLYRISMVTDVLDDEPPVAWTSILAYCEEQSHAHFEYCVSQEEAGIFTFIEVWDEEIYQDLYNPEGEAE